MTTSGDDTGEHILLRELAPGGLLTGYERLSQSAKAPNRTRKKAKLVCKLVWKLLLSPVGLLDEFCLSKPLSLPDPCSYYKS